MQSNLKPERQDDELPECREWECRAWKVVALTAGAFFLISATLLWLVSGHLKTQIEESARLVNRMCVDQRAIQDVGRRVERMEARMQYNRRSPR